MADQQFCLRWNNHQSTLISVFDTLLENGTLVDCTLAAEGQYLKAHKVVLSACSPYLETLLSQHYEKHPIVILKDVKFSELKSMMDYMYRGEVNISQDQLGTFLKAAESLQIKGLSDNGADGDARDVGSTAKATPARKTNQPAQPQSRPEPQRPDLPESPAHRDDGTISPSSRKRRRIRRGSQGDDSSLGDSHLETSNSCDAQSTPIVPNIPASSSITATPIKAPIVKPEQTELVNRIDTNSLPPESGLLKEKIEPSEPLLEPKTEYLDDMNNDDSVEDLTLDDDDEMDGMDVSNMSNMSNMSRPGPSHGNDISQLSNQGFNPWQLGGNQSGTDEVFMAAQEAVGAHRDSQDNATANVKKSASKKRPVVKVRSDLFGKTEDSMELNIPVELNLPVRYLPLSFETTRDLDNTDNSTEEEMSKKTLDSAECRKFDQLETTLSHELQLKKNIVTVDSEYKLESKTDEHQMNSLVLNNTSTEFANLIKEAGKKLLENKMVTLTKPNNSVHFQIINDSKPLIRKEVLTKEENPTDILNLNLQPDNCDTILNDVRKLFCENKFKDIPKQNADKRVRSIDAINRRSTRKTPSSNCTTVKDDNEISIQLIIDEKPANVLPNSKSKRFPKKIQSKKRKSRIQRDEKIKCEFCFVPFETNEKLSEHLSLKHSGLSLYF